MTDMFYLYSKQLSFSQRTGMMAHNPFQNYKVIVKKVDRGYLTEEKLTRILKKDFAIK